MSSDPLTQKQIADGLGVTGSSAPAPMTADIVHDLRERMIWMAANTGGSETSTILSSAVAEIDAQAGRIAELGRKIARDEAFLENTKWLGNDEAHRELTRQFNRAEAAEAEVVRLRIALHEIIGEDSNCYVAAVARKALEKKL